MLQTLTVTLSMGLVNFRVLQTDQELIAAADGILYQAKLKGRNRVELAC